MDLTLLALQLLLMFRHYGGFELCEAHRNHEAVLELERAGLIAFQPGHRTYPFDRTASRWYELRLA